MPADFASGLPASWGDGHRAFLQALMSRGTLTFAEARPIMAAILAAAGAGARAAGAADAATEAQFRAAMGQLRAAVAPLDYDVRSAVHHRAARTPVWALVNAHSDPATQLATSRSPDELAFLKRVLDAMFATYNTPRQEVMAVTAAQARRCARPPPPTAATAATAAAAAAAADRGLKHSEVERLLPSLVAEGWFEQSGAFYSLSARALMELTPWLLDEYNDPDAGPDDWQRIKSCEACKDIVTAGQRCPERDCNVRIHDICADAFWRTRRAGPVCPKCGTAWTGTNYVGERSVTETAAAHRRQPKASRKSNENSSIVNGEADEDGHEEEDGEEDGD